MLIKTADDKSKRLALLEDLQKSSMLDRQQREWLKDELLRLKRGIQGERDAAHYLDNYLKDDPDRVVIHDLRISVEGQVAQIDHLVITRSLYVFLLETKNFAASRSMITGSSRLSIPVSASSESSRLSSKAVATRDRCSSSVIS